MASDQKLLEYATEWWGLYKGRTPVGPFGSYHECRMHVAERARNGR